MKWKEAEENCILRSIIIRVFTRCRIIKSRRMGWIGHVAGMAEIRNACKP
jgi:hypothetical protein